MNYYGPRPKIETGLYHYTCTNGGLVHAVGYCAISVPCPTCRGQSIDMRFLGSQKKPAPWTCDTCQDQGIVKADPQCPGHKTEEEACEHYKEYLLDYKLQFWGDHHDADTLNRCGAEGCEAYTSGGASIGGSRSWSLCEKHRTKEIVSNLLEVGQSISSY